MQTSQSSLNVKSISARLAQLVERKALNLVVVGSSPTTIYRDRTFQTPKSNSRVKTFTLSVTLFSSPII
ncbi:hypothetical protein L1887_08944 [Cichorium endivia]|nr:hypothetical protein L1887_08944 [Cichorium endivia]